MTLWHLAWMHVTSWLIVAALLALMFTVTYALEYSGCERFRRQRFYFFAWRQHYKRDGLPCTQDWWAHGEMIEVPGARHCRRCGWKEPER